MTFDLNSVDHGFESYQTTDKIIVACVTVQAQHNNNFPLSQNSADLSLCIKAKTRRIQRTQTLPRLCLLTLSCDLDL